MVTITRGHRSPPPGRPEPWRRGRAVAGALSWTIAASWVAGVYVVVLTATADLSHSEPQWWAIVIASVLVAVTVAPVQRWARRGIEDVLYARPDDAFAVVTTLNRRLETQRDGEAPPDEESSVAAVLARTLGVPYVEVLEAGVTTSVVGDRPTDRVVHTVPLTYADTELGAVLVGGRRPGSVVSPDELGLLRDLARQLAVGMYAVRASAEIAASRTALVGAREEERRRIRRDLHDGLGPTLASLRLQVAAAQRTLPADAAEVAGMLADVGDQLNRTTAEVRRLVYGLRPPLLDELGLVAAIRNHPASLGAVTVRVEPDQVPALPAAVEVALYRIATECIHNAVRHAAAAHATVDICVDDAQVRMTVADDGRGLPTPVVAGVGMSAIRERAAEVGGSVDWIPNDDGGVSVVTTVSLERSAGA